MSKSLATVLSDVLALSNEEKYVVLQTLIAVSGATASAPTVQAVTTAPSQTKSEKSQSKKSRKSTKYSYPTEDIAVAWELKPRSKSVGFGKLKSVAFQALKAQFPSGTEYNKETKKIDFASCKEAKAFVEAHPVVTVDEMKPIIDAWNSRA